MNIPQLFICFLLVQEMKLLQKFVFIWSPTLFGPVHSFLISCLLAGVVLWNRPEEMPANIAHLF